MPTRERRLGRHAQAGFTLGQVLILLMVIGGIGFAAMVASRQAQKGTEFRTTAGRLETIEKALIRYVTLNGFLPCPASGLAGDGAPDPVGPVPTVPVTACNFPDGTVDGVVPWLALGQKSEQALDPWGRQVSYRVYGGATGVTRADGLNMWNCNLDASATGSAVTDCTGGSPPPDHPDDFVLNKGLTVRDSPAGTLLNSPAAGSGAAFLLISHGRDGRGATLPGGAILAQPAATGYEFPNADLAVGTDGALSSGNAYIVAAFADDIDNPTADSHFDDVTRRMTIRELADEAGLGPRNHGSPAGPNDVPGAQLSFSDSELPTFVATTDAPGSELAAPTVEIAAADEANTVTFGAAPALSRACLWAPDPWALSGKVVRLFYEFSVALDAGGTNGEGFVTGFLRGDTTVGSNLCGDSGVNLGWRNVGLGTLPSDRFGVEFDTAETTSGGFFDPTDNHLAVDRNDVTHALSAGPRCLVIAPGILTPDPPDGCVEGPSANWLEDGNLNFHMMRVEVADHAGDGCGADEARVTAYLWANGSACTDCDDLTADYAAADADRSVYHCAPAGAAMASVIFGFTAGASANPSTLVVRRFGIGSFDP